MIPIDRLPADIQEVVERVYRRADRAFVESRIQPSTRLGALVKNAAGSLIVKEQTDFNYGRAHVFDVFLTADSRVCIASLEVQRKLLEEFVAIESVRLSASVLAPYFMISFARSQMRNGDVENSFTWNQISEAQGRIERALESEMLATGFTRLSKEIAETIVPDVETELLAIGTATVADLLMGSPS